MIVCGHYGCGGIAAAMERPDSKLGVVNRWLKHIREVKVRNWEELQGIRDLERRAERLVELNVLAQVQNLKRNWRVKEAVKERGLEVHG